VTVVLLQESERAEDERYISDTLSERKELHEQVFKSNQAHPGFKPALFVGATAGNGWDEVN
jgi:hypothetical protein